MTPTLRPFLVQSSSVNADVPSVNVVRAFDANPPVGSLLVGAIQWEDPSSGILPTWADDGNGAWSRMNNVWIGANGLSSRWQLMFKKKNSLGTATTVTVTFNQTVQHYVLAFATYFNASDVDGVSNKNQSSDGSGNWFCPTITTNESADLIAAWSLGQSTSSAAVSPFNLDESHDNVGMAHNSLAESVPGQAYTPNLVAGGGAGTDGILTSFLVRPNLSSANPPAKPLRGPSR